MKKVWRKPEITIAPLIDCVFLLLIFFAVTISFSRETGLKLNKPEAKTASFLKKEDIVISISKQGRIYLWEKEIDLTQLQPKLSAELKKNPSGAVVIVSDKGVLCGLLVDVLDECKLAGAKRLSLAARVER